MCRGVLSGRKVDSVEDMGLWLDVDKLDDEGGASDPPDLFVIGFQEVVYLFIYQFGRHFVPPLQTLARGMYLLMTVLRLFTFASLAQPL